MSLHIPPTQELTEKERLLAALIGLDQHIPSGYQTAIPLRLAQAIATVEKLFTDHELPMREALVSEMRLWLDHAEHGLRLVQQCDQLMQMAIRTVDSQTQSR